MKIQILEKGKDRLKLEIHDNLTLVNLLNENLWKQKIKYAAYSVDHPYLSKPVLTVSSTNPKKSLLDAADQIIEDVEELRKKVQHALK
jgi:DNA-directed RNA polymerase subunit L